MSYDIDDSSVNLTTFSKFSDAQSSFASDTDSSKGTWHKKTDANAENKAEYYYFTDQIDNNFQHTLGGHLYRGSNEVVGNDALDGSTMFAKIRTFLGFTTHLPGSGLYTNGSRVIYGLLNGNNYVHYPPFNSSNWPHAKLINGHPVLIPFDNRIQDSYSLSGQPMSYGSDSAAYHYINGKNCYVAAHYQFKNLKKRYLVTFKRNGYTESATELYDYTLQTGFDSPDTSIAPSSGNIVFSRSLLIPRVGLSDFKIVSPVRGITVDEFGTVRGWPLESGTTTFKVTFYAEGATNNPQQSLDFTIDAMGFKQAQAAILANSLDLIIPNSNYWDESDKPYSWDVRRHLGKLPIARPIYAEVGINDWSEGTFTGNIPDPAVDSGRARAVNQLVNTRPTIYFDTMEMTSYAENPIHGGSVIRAAITGLGRSKCERYYYPTTTDNSWTGLWDDLPGNHSTNHWRSRFLINNGDGHWEFDPYNQPQLQKDFWMPVSKQIGHPPQGAAYGVWTRYPYDAANWYNWDTITKPYLDSDIELYARANVGDRKAWANVGNRTDLPSNYLHRSLSGHGYPTWGNTANTSQGHRPGNGEKLYYYGVSEVGMANVIVALTKPTDIYPTATASGGVVQANNPREISPIQPHTNATNIFSNFTHDGLPLGLFLDSTTGIVTGTPVFEKQQEFTVSCSFPTNPYTNPLGTGISQTIVVDSRTPLLSYPTAYKFHPFLPNSESQGVFEASRAPAMKNSQQSFSIGKSTLVTVGKGTGGYQTVRASDRDPFYLFVDSDGTHSPYAHNEEHTAVFDAGEGHTWRVFVHNTALDIAGGDLLRILSSDEEIRGYAPPPEISHNENWVYAQTGNFPCTNDMRTWTFSESAGSHIKKRFIKFFYQSNSSVKKSGWMITLARNGAVAPESDAVSVDQSTGDVTLSAPPGFDHSTYVVTMLENGFDPVHIPITVYQNLFKSTYADSTGNSDLSSANYALTTRVVTPTHDAYEKSGVERFVGTTQVEDQHIVFVDTGGVLQPLNKNEVGDHRFQSSTAFHEFVFERLDLPQGATFKYSIDNGISFHDAVHGAIVSASSTKEVLFQWNTVNVANVGNHEGWVVRLSKESGVPAYPDALVTPYATVQTPLASYASSVPIIAPRIHKCTYVNEKENNAWEIWFDGSEIFHAGFGDIRVDTGANRPLVSCAGRPMAYFTDATYEQASPSPTRYILLERGLYTNLIYSNVVRDHFITGGSQFETQKATGNIKEYIENENDVPVFVIPKTSSPATEFTIQAASI